MTELKSDFLKTVQDRGYMHQCTDLEALDKKASNGVVTAYIGFDCTAPSLHVGSLLPIMMLRTLQKTGHKPIVLMGGGTTLVGDPSGKDESRKMLTETDIQDNMDGIKQIFAKFLTFGDGPTDAVMVNNADWLKSLNYIEFLRDYGPHFTINRMMTFDSVKLRLEREQPLTFLEFNYMILQAYDFMELNKRMDCDLQMGGSDQWGNIINGVELTRRAGGNEAFGLTTPLLTTSSGAKMGKTAAGAVWLNSEQLSPYDYWQYWRNTEDADVGRFLRLFTELPMDEIARLEALEGQDINEAKKILADEATRMCHGEDAAKAAKATAQKTFEQGQLGADLPTIEVPKSDLDNGITAFATLVTVGFCKSNGEARRMVKGGGARINDVQVKDENQAVTTADLNDDGVIKVSAGKKRHALLKAV
ncbi:MAG: tyrosine--tRNA ligase [Magnetovibrio sp.]|nr:tyrosine--tRNA ligase [Magnetovibrio sp.]